MAFVKSKSINRNRVVVFRLSQEEYEDLKSATLSAGARSISDYARTGLLTLIGVDPLGDMVERRFGKIEQTLSKLHEAIQDVAERMSAAPGPNNGHSE